MIRILVSLVFASILAATVVATGALPAGAEPVHKFPDAKNWVLLEGTCGGEPAVLADPRGGNTAFVIDGTSVGIGKSFTFVDADTGEVLEQTIAGKGVSRDTLTECRFLFTVDLPDGPHNIIFIVEGLLTPQGQH